MKRGFSDNEEGVGGMAVLVPMARDGVGGEVGRRVRMLDGGLEVGKMYWWVVR